VQSEGLRVIGVMGGVGSGKSTAARFLAEIGAGTVLDADAEVGALLAQEEVLLALEHATGAGLRRSDGALDRAALAARIFQDPDAKARVEAVLHPRVRARHWAALAELERRRPGALAVLDIPLLLEGGLIALCDLTFFVDAPEAVRAARATARHGWSPEEWARREAGQRPLAAKRAAARAILVNDAGPERLHEQCARWAVALRDLPVRPLRARWPTPEALPAPQSGA
jgi:dephospho-CoA kinase